MKFRILLPLIILQTLNMECIAAGSSAADANSVPQTSQSAAFTRARADEDWEFIAALIRATYPTGQNYDLVPTLTEWWELSLLTLRDAGLVFCDKYPTDPRRWEWLVAATQTEAYYYKDRNPFVPLVVEGRQVKPEVDEQARDAWNRQVSKLRAACYSSPTCTAEQKAAVRYYELIWPQRSELASAVPLNVAVTGDLTAGKLGKFDGKKWENAALEYGERFPFDMVNGRTLARNTLNWYEKYAGDEEAATAFRKRLMSSPNASMRALGGVAGLLNQARDVPMEMRFTALDGREVDLSKFRGKVVLIDFWASTWCGACRVETPHLKALYEKYHDLGFEMVGITFEMKESDKLFLQNYLKRNGIAWPQYFDGKGMESPYAQKYGVTSIPQWYLLDKNGLLVTTRGEIKKGNRLLVLEETVRDLLGFSP